MKSDYPKGILKSGKIKTMSVRKFLWNVFVTFAENYQKRFRLPPHQLSRAALSYI